MSELFKLKENTLVPHPDGGITFGTIPDMPNFGLPGGEVYLCVGAHRGTGRGFGVIHIWEAHKADLLRYGCASIEGVATHIAKMITPGAKIYCEFREQRDGNRIAVIRSTAGMVILEPRHHRGRGLGYYVITWYPKRQPDGTLVGTVPRVTRPGVDAE